MPHQFATVCKVLDLSDDLLNQWLHRKHIIVDHPARGKGSRNEFGDVNVCQVELFKRLAKDRVNLKEAHEIAFDAKVRAELERQIRAAKAVNYLMKFSTPVVMLVCMRQFNDKVDIELIEGGKELGSLFKRMARAQSNVTVNLTQIAYDVSRALVEEP